MEGQQTNFPATTSWLAMILSGAKEIIITFIKRPIARSIIITLISGGVAILAVPLWEFLIEWFVREGLKRHFDVELPDNVQAGVGLITLGLVMYVLKYEIHRPKLIIDYDVLEVVCNRSTKTTRNIVSDETFVAVNTREDPYEAFSIYINFRNKGHTRLFDMKWIASLKVVAQEARFPAIDFSEADYKKYDTVQALSIEPGSAICFDVIGFILKVPPVLKIVEYFGTPVLFDCHIKVSIRAEYYNDSWYFKLIKKKFYTDVFELNFQIVDKNSTPIILKMGYVHLGDKMVTWKSKRHQH